MKWLQAIRNNVPKHKYAINAHILGDHNELAWSNLGYWEDATSSYPEACQALADQLAQSLELSSEHHLLDLACGQGASLLHWQNNYHIHKISTVELQKECVQNIQAKLFPPVYIHCESFLNLKTISFQQKFNVVICIDAAYHCNLNSFLKSVNSVLNSNGKLGFHYLMLSDEWQSLNSLQKKKYKWLLKAADVNLEHLMMQKEMKQTIEKNEFKHVQILDLSKQVFAGFANYVKDVLNLNTQTNKLDSFKIEMTAKLCSKLYEDGLVKYVQVTAKNNN
ncbi:SAM-dependent methyltransferase [Acinetobacter faecalis]|uniref:Methyltransferase domain-containing protein n=1 Tax=Acinetobacter faecalis TaxID=2665161 RepID=A0ABU5GMZ7_9GAMM|nr:methyltransferase domain-containing protein [Acinetobacter faecalis]MDY6551458.1 methyltransferase domain-containing protein [Acinetobacter faecalis]